MYREFLPDQSIPRLPSDPWVREGPVNQAVHPDQEVREVRGPCPECPERPERPECWGQLDPGGRAVRENLGRCQVFPATQ